MVAYYLAATTPDQLDRDRIRDFFDQYQSIWDRVDERWSEYRRGGGPKD